MAHGGDAGERAGPVDGDERELASDEPVGAFRDSEVSRRLVGEHAHHAVIPCESRESDPVRQVLLDLDARLLQRGAVRVGRRVHVGAVGGAWNDDGVKVRTDNCRSMYPKTSRPINRFPTLKSSETEIIFN